MSRSHSDCPGNVGHHKISTLLPGAIRGVATEGAFHLFTTITLVALAAPGVTSWRALGVVGLVGLAADIVRHVLSPECRTSPEVMWHQFKSGVTNSPDFKRSLRFWRLVFNSLSIIWVTYFVVFDIIMRPGEATYVPVFFKWTLPLETIYSATSSIDRRAVTQLIAHGYPNRAQVISFFLTTNACFFLLYGVMAFSGYTFFATFEQIASLFRRGRQDTRVSTSLWISIAFFVFGFFGHLMFSNIIYLRWSGHDPGGSWNLTEDNEVVFYSGLAEFACANATFFSYQVILIARCLTSKGTDP